MNSIPSIPEITASSFDRHVLRSELPVLVLFHADGDTSGQHLLNWLGEWTARADSLLNIVRIAQAEARILAGRWGLPSIPGFLLFYAGSVCYQFCGHVSRRELDEVLTRAAILGLNRGLAGPPDEYNGVPPADADE
jgi:thioredoxin-like negative regulator of GroEL